MTKNMYREIEARQFWDTTTITTKGTKTEILFWLSNLNILNTNHLLGSFKPKVFHFLTHLAYSCGGFSLINSERYIAHKKLS